MLAFALFSGIAMVYVKNILTVDSTVKEINDLQNEIKKESVEKNKLNAEIEKLISRDRIVEIAKTRLGLDYPTNPVIIIQSESKE